MKKTWKNLFFVAFFIIILILIDRYIYDVPFVYTGSSADFYVMAAMVLTMLNSGIHLWRYAHQTRRRNSKKID